MPCHTRLQTADRPDEVTALELLLSKSHRLPDLSFLREPEALWHHSNNRERDAVQGHRSTDHAGVRSKAALPEAVAQQHHAVIPFGVLIGCEAAAKYRLRSEQGR